MKTKFLHFIVSTFLIGIIWSCDSDEDIELIEPDYQLTLAKELADHLIENGFEVQLEGSRINIHRRVIKDAEKFSTTVHEHLLTQEIIIDKIDLLQSIKYGSLNSSKARIECGHTSFEEYANGSCTFEYCWDDTNIDYFHIDVYCA
ncbi:MAG: hypothetical protein GDA51_00360 [Ekhidna sp.]|nr:hypothetical protein [Ekhidna sp.]MBC6409570.1 hypothetical protein [Ekhidna sp.]MBC6424934.1 hypothetical protein [Ekhidna sp.]